MSKRIVTSGQRYVDIDAYAGIIAYAELLNAQGQEAVAVATSVLNESITHTVRSWQAPLLTEYEPAPDDTFTLIDISDPDWVDQIVAVDRIDEVIDHHLGFEDYWRERIGDKTHIEFVGAACTQVYEQWVAAGLFGRMSVTSAKLLMCGILDNTLNFKATVTTERDLAAYDALRLHAEMAVEWPAQYFSECQKAILAHPKQAIMNDSKILTFRTFPRPLSVGQLVVWDAAQVLQQDLDTVERVLGGVKPEWFMNIVSVGKGKSYLFARDIAVQEWVGKLLGVTFEEDLAEANRLWLRKEIVKQDLRNSAAF